MLIWRNIYYISDDVSVEFKLFKGAPNGIHTYSYKLVALNRQGRFADDYKDVKTGGRSYCMEETIELALKAIQEIEDANT